MNSVKAYTLGDLFRRDIKAKENISWLFYNQSFCLKGFRFLNEKYAMFDFPPSSFDYHTTIYPRRFLSIVGDDFPVLADGHVMNDFFQRHWTKWVPQFKLPTIKSIDEGIQDDTKIVCVGPMDCIPDAKHFHHPKLHYDLQRKSTISKIGVPCPRVMSEDEVTFPCLVKADMTGGGKGNFVAENKEELEAVLHHLVDEVGWKGGYVIEELLTNVSKVVGYYFYLSKARDITWLGIYEECFENRFGWAGCFMDLDKQEDLKKLAHHEFTLPLAKYLSDAGYFGLVSYEIVITPSGRYMVDLNLRVTGSTTHVLIAKSISQLGYTKSSCALGKPFDCSLEALVQKVDQINTRFEGRVIIMSGVDKENGCVADYSAHGKSEDDLRQMLKDLGI